MVSLSISRARVTSFLSSSSLADAKSFFSFWINLSLSQILVLRPQSSRGQLIIFSFVFSFKGKELVHSSLPHLNKGAVRTISNIRNQKIRFFSSIQHLLQNKRLLFNRYFNLKKITGN